MSSVFYLIQNQITIRTEVIISNLQARNATSARTTICRAYRFLWPTGGGKSLVEEITATVLWEGSRQEVRPLLIVIVRSVGVVV